MLEINHEKNTWDQMGAMFFFLFFYRNKTVRISKFLLKTFKQKDNTTKHFELMPFSPNFRPNLEVNGPILVDTLFPSHRQQDRRESDGGDHNLWPWIFMSSSKEYFDLEARGSSRWPWRTTAMVKLENFFS